MAAHAEHVGTAEFRAHLAKYLESARSGRPVVIQERGKDAYVLVRFEEAGARRPFGCMSGRTEYAEGAIVNASEKWAPGDMP
jgi:prevent-host-death family protein